MDLFEIIGFFVLVLFLLAPVLRKIFGKKKKVAKGPPPTIEREKVIRPPIAEEIAHYPPPPPEPIAPPPLLVEEPPRAHRLSTVAGRELHPSLEEYKGMSATGAPSFTSTIGMGEPISEVGLRYKEDIAYRQHREGASHIQALLRRSGAGKEMILLHEVLSPPKSLR